MTVETGPIYEEFHSEESQIECHGRVKIADGDSFERDGEEDLKIAGKYHSAEKLCRNARRVSDYVGRSLRMYQRFKTLHQAEDM